MWSRSSSDLTEHQRRREVGQGSTSRCLRRTGVVVRPGFGRQQSALVIELSGAELRAPSGDVRHCHCDHGPRVLPSSPQMRRFLICADTSRTPEKSRG